MGPSGAGKTTLLDILAGRRCGWGVSGDVRMSGRQTSPGMRMKMSGYVLQVTISSCWPLPSPAPAEPSWLQDDILPGASLVLEYLMFHAKLRLPANMPKQKRVQRVMNIIQELGLQKALPPS